MMENNRNEEFVSYLRDTGVLKSDAIEKALLETPRHLFVPDDMRDSAYNDQPLPIGYGQTISQPSVVVAMTQILEPKQGQKILEIGTGSGWQAALLSRIVGNKGKIFSIEIVPELAKFARDNIAKLGIKNVEVVWGNGSAGLKENAPFDRIIITAAAPSIPDTLKEQLKIGGRIVAPVGDMHTQKMVIVKRMRKGFEEKAMPNMFVFVPLRGEYGFEE